jgi:hypothetical protein
MRLAARWISSPLPCQLRLALRAFGDENLRYTIPPCGCRRLGRGILSGHFSNRTERRNSALDRGGKVAGREVRVALNHRQRAPPTEFLDREQVHPGHQKPTGERVPVAMPCVPIEPAGALPGVPERGLSPFDGTGEGPGHGPIRRGEDRLGGIVRALPIGANVQQARPDHRVHWDTAAFMRVVSQPDGL